MLRALNESGIEYMVTGAIATNLHASPRSTRDADLVVRIDGAQLNDLAKRLPRDVRLDRPLTYETITMTNRYDFHVAGTLFRIELFLLTDDAHHQERFRRRVRGLVLGTDAWIPTPEDIIVQKPRWSSRAHRAKDYDNAVNVVREQHRVLDWPCVERWCREHRTLDLLDNVRREAIID